MRLKDFDPSLMRRRSDRSGWNTFTAIYRQRMLADPTVMMEIYRKAKSAEHYGNHDVAEHLRRCLDIKLVEH